MSTPACPWNRLKVGVGRWSFTPTTWINSFVNGSPWWMPANQANWKLASGDMTESTGGSSYVSSSNSTLEATSSGGLEAIPTSKIEKEQVDAQTTRRLRVRPRPAGDRPGVAIAF